MQVHEEQAKFRALIEFRGEIAQRETKFAAIVRVLVIVALDANCRNVNALRAIPLGFDIEAVGDHERIEARVIAKSHIAPPRIGCEPRPTISAALKKVPLGSGTILSLLNW